MHKIYETNKHSTPEVSSDFNKKERPKRSGGAAVKITVIFADNQSDCSKNMQPSNMRNISGSLTNQIADIFYADNNTYIRKFDVF